MEDGCGVLTGELVREVEGGRERIVVGADLPLLHGQGPHSLPGSVRTPSMATTALGASSSIQGEGLVDGAAVLAGAAEEVGEQQLAMPARCVSAK